MVQSLRGLAFILAAFWLLTGALVTFGVYGIGSPEGAHAALLALRKLGFRLGWVDAPTSNPSSSG